MQRKNNTQTALLLFATVLMVGSLAILHPKEVFAATYFGGMKTASLSCTCSGNTLIYINKYGTGGGSLALIYDGSGRLFSNNNIMGTYLLGSYTQGGQCQMIAYPECITINSDGRFDSSPGTGTS